MSVTTVPDQVIAGKKTKITYTNGTYIQNENDIYRLNNNSGSITSDVHYGEAVTEELYSTNATGINVDNGETVDLFYSAITFDKENNLYSGIFNQNNVLPDIYKNNSALGYNMNEGGYLPTGLLIDTNNKLYFSVWSGGAIYKISSTGDVSLFFNNDNITLGLCCLCLDKYNYLYSSAGNFNYILQINPSGIIQSTITTNNTDNSLDPYSIVINNDGIIFYNLFYFGNYNSNPNTSFSNVIYKIEPTNSSEPFTYADKSEQTFYSFDAGYLVLNLTIDNYGIIYCIVKNTNPIEYEIYGFNSSDANPSPIFSYKLTNVPVLRTGFAFDSNNDLFYSTASQVIKVHIPRTFTFKNVILPKGNNDLYISNFSLLNNPVVYDNINVYAKSNESIICFKEGTKILCKFSSTQDKYIPIEKITDNMYIKTYKHGYVRAKAIIKGKLYNTSSPTINKMYKYSKAKNPKLIEDLYVTGCHAVLYDKLSPLNHLKMNKLTKKFNIGYNLTIDGKHKLISYFDEKCEPINEEKEFDIYHILLENNNVFSNYGIYANGILAESTDDFTLERMKNSGYEIINSGFNKKISGNQPVKLLLK